MKKSIIALALVAFLWNSNTANAQKKSTSSQNIKVGIDLVDLKDDKVKVTVQAPKIKSDKITYSIPKIVPGTYSEDNDGKNIEDLKAFDAKGTALAVTKTDDNTWSISSAKNLAKITYLVSLSNYNKVNPKLFRISADAFDIRNSKNANLRLNIKQFPPYVQGIRIEPETVEFIIRKNK